MTTLVCIPYWNVPDLIDRCVRSVLGQSERDIAVVVIGDGQCPPVSVSDSRLEVYVLPDNHGPYFAQQVALQASPFPSYAPVGADDWLEPDHIERLQEVGGDAVATGAVWFHDRQGRVKEHAANYEVGLFSTVRLLEIGGHNPSERMGQDTLMIRLLRITGELRSSTHPTYHRVKRENSLMTHPATGRGTPARNDMRRRNREVFAECEKLAPDREAIRAFRESRSYLHDRLAVAEHASRLAEHLGRAVAA